MAISGAYAIRNPARLRRTVRSRSSEKKSGVRPPKNLDLPLAQLRETLGHPVDGNTCVPVAAVVVNDQPKWPWIRQARQAFERAPIRVIAAQIDDPHRRCCCCAGTAAT